MRDLIIIVSTDNKPSLTLYVAQFTVFLRHSFPLSIPAIFFYHKLNRQNSMVLDGYD